MAKRRDKEYRRMLRSAAVAGLMNTSDGRWIPEDGSATARNNRSGYKLDRVRRKQKKTGCFRNA